MDEISGIANCKYVETLESDLHRLFLSGNYENLYLDFNRLTPDEPDSQAYILCKKAQAVYSSVDGKMPTLKELSAEYDALKAEKENDDAALEELKPQLTTLNHIKYNFDILDKLTTVGPNYFKGETESE